MTPAEIIIILFFLMVIVMLICSFEKHVKKLEDRIADLEVFINR